MDKKIKNRCAILLGVSMLLLGGCATMGVSNPDDLCDIFKENRGWYKASLKAQKKWGTPIQIPMAIMYQESSFQKRARPARRYYLGFIPGKRKSSAYGYAQAIDGTWQDYEKATGQYWRERNRFGDALDFIHYYINRISRENGISKSDAYHLYLNYHEGTAGYRRKSHLKKTSVLSAAKRVQSQSNQYAQQYAQCEKSLKRGWFARLLGY